MPLVTGEKIGAYEILALIGAGGMGQGYRARDPRRGREVALKVSAVPLASVSSERRASFPESSQRLHAFRPEPLAMELVEGPTLAERIEQQGPCFGWGV